MSTSESTSASEAAVVDDADELEDITDDTTPLGTYEPEEDGEESADVDEEDVATEEDNADLADENEEANSNSEEEDDVSEEEDDVSEEENDDSEEEDVPPLAVEEEDGAEIDEIEDETVPLASPDVVAGAKHCISHFLELILAGGVTAYGVGSTRKQKKEINELKKGKRG